MEKSYTTRIDPIGKKHYRIVINLGKDPVTGTYKKKRKDVHGDRPQAEAVLLEMLNELYAPPVAEPPKTKISDQPLGDFLIYWVDLIAKKSLEKNTYQSYRWEIENHMIPNIGHIPLSELVPMHIQTFYDYKSEAGRLNGSGGLSNRSIKYKHSILNQALMKAEDLELIEKNPCAKADVPKDKKTQKEKMAVLSKDKLRELLEAIIEHNDYHLIFTAAYTGMRISELLGLRWLDILWDQKQIRIEMTMHVLNNGEFEHRPRTKNKTSTRTIDVTDNVLNVLRNHRKQQMEMALFNKLNLVFPNTNPKKLGLPQNRKNVSHRWANLAAKMGHKGMRFHDLRHTHATILLEAGEMLKAVSERLGHADELTTTRLYGHVRPAKAVATAEKFDQLINS